MIKECSLLLLALVGCNGSGGGTGPDGESGADAGSKPSLDAPTGSSPSGQLSFLDNGAQKTEIVLPTFAPNYLQSPDDFLQVIALQPINGAAGAFDFTLLATHPLAPGSFTCDGSDIVTVGHVRMAYNPAGDDTGQIPSDCTLTITQAPDASSMRFTGTFAGTIVTSKTGSHVITEGRFDVTALR